MREDSSETDSRSGRVGGDNGRKRVGSMSLACFREKSTSFWFERKILGEGKQTATWVTSRAAPTRSKILSPEERRKGETATLIETVRNESETRVLFLFVFFEGS